MRSASTASCLLLLPLLVGPALGLRSRVVSTAHGLVEGALSDHGSCYEFLGVRYGVPVKFRAAAEPQSYSGIFKADARYVACAQPPTSLPFGVPSNNEDCLVLNVFTPASANDTSALPVMVFLHGGDFGYGSSTPSFYNPRYLVARGTVVVTVNYRLNIYGFLNLGVEEAPGNAGLKDQRAGLRWVKNNIAKFGGDPENVTVFGHGAGATSAIYLTLSSSTKGLFKRIIVESGTLFAKNSYDPKPMNAARLVAGALGSKADTPNDLLKLFTETPVDRVMEALAKLPESTALFCPSMETIFEGEEPFLIDTPYNILATGISHPSFNPVTILIGHTTAETLVNMIDTAAVKNRVEMIRKRDFSSFLQRSIQLPTPKDVSEVLDLLKMTYLGNRTDYEGTVGGMINFDTDFLFTGPMSLFGDLYTNASKLPVYQYVFEYSGARNLGRRLLQLNSTVVGTTHYDELFYLFELEASPLPMDEKDAHMVGLMTTLWTNFAKFGTPSPPDAESRWLPYPHRLAMREQPEYVVPVSPERADFWRAIYFKYGADIRRA